MDNWFGMGWLFVRMRISDKKNQLEDRVFSLGTEFGNIGLTRFVFMINLYCIRFTVYSFFKCWFH